MTDSPHTVPLSPSGRIEVSIDGAAQLFRLAYYPEGPGLDPAHCWRSKDKTLIGALGKLRDLATFGHDADEIEAYIFSTAWGAELPRPYDPATAPFPEGF